MKARRGKRKEDEVIGFELQLGEKLTLMSRELEQGIYRISEYRPFKVFDPKERQIYAPAYRDRVMQHSLCDNVLVPALDRRLIYDNAASRIGKGTHFAMDRLTKFMTEHYRKHGTEGYILKCDISKYFDSIDHRILFNALQ